MTTVGYGDIIVTTTLERAFCILGMLIGATVFGYIVGNVSVMMESFDLQSALRTQKMDRVKVGTDAMDDQATPPQKWPASASLRLRCPL